MSDTQTYYAKSAYTDPQNLASIASIIVGLLALPEVTAIIPTRYMPAILAISASISLILRITTGVRPVANIPPGAVKPVEVDKLKPTEKGSETRKVG